jgi:dTDP-glucose 4,6-dehydratase
MGTFHLIEAFRNYIAGFDSGTQKSKRFIHVSTDEVFGQLGKEGYFVEESPYQPNSPYSASKAASDHIARAWHHTYGVPVITTNCSNNYGPRQFPEKLIPRMITCALNGEKLPVYGKGENIRDWIHVEDHSRGILLAMEKGNVGESYCFGGRSERTNLDVVKTISRTLDEMKPRGNGKSYSDLIAFVEDRKGHDFRYAIDDSKARKQLGFVSEYENFEKGLQNTIQWYLGNQKWIDAVLAKK